VGRLNPQQLKDLSDELATLAKQQSDARMTEVFVRMTTAEIKAFRPPNRTHLQDSHHS
jgi:hypothetical protein